MKIQYGDNFKLRDTSKSDEVTTLHWWQVGLNSVLPGNFFGDRENLRYRYTLIKKRFLWLLVDPETPIVLRAFHTSGTGSAESIGTSGNGLYAWKMDTKDGKWSSLPYRYKTVSGIPGKGCWIILEDTPRPGQVYVRDTDNYIELKLDNKNSMILGTGSVVPVSFLEPANINNTKFRYAGKGNGFVQVSSNTPIKLIDFKNNSPVTYVHNSKAKSWTITSRSSGKLQTKSVSSPRTGSGGLSGLVFDILDIADPVQGYKDPFYKSSKVWF